MTDIERWCRQKSGEARRLSDSRVAKYFSHRQPQIALASVYTIAKAEKRPFTASDIALRTAIPYSTVKAILLSFENFGLLMQLERVGKAGRFKARIHEVEKVIRSIAKGG